MSSGDGRGSFKQLTDKGLTLEQGRGAGDAAPNLTSWRDSRGVGNQWYWKRYLTCLCPWARESDRLHYPQHWPSFVLLNTPVADWNQTPTETAMVETLAALHVPVSVPPPPPPRFPQSALARRWNWTPYGRRRVCLYTFRLVRPASIRPGFWQQFSSCGN